jgi:hypothetical protein
MPLLRPSFDNSHIGDFARWAIDNRVKLAAYWAALAKVDTEPCDTRYGVWVEIQWECEQLLTKERIRVVQHLELE